MTKVSGIISLCLGVLILILDYIFSTEGMWIALIYGAPLIIIGFVVILRRSENSIEMINYRRLKNNGKK